MRSDYSVGGVAALMRDASKSTTYKPALLKAMARLAHRDSGLSVPLTNLGGEFVRLYWDQTVVYHLRQAAVLSKEATVVKLIRETAIAKGVRKLEDLPTSDREHLITKMAKLLTVSVLAAFHSSKPSTMSALYTWDQAEKRVVFSPGSHAFLRDNVLAIELIANYHWAAYLEGCNQLAPRIIQKVSREAVRRSSLARYMALLMRDGEFECFYCGRQDRDERGMQVDHVIPWSFLLEDPTWDLVLACRVCNARKSDWLPAYEYIEKLKRRNHGFKMITGNASLLVTEPDIDRFYNAAISVEWPGFWTPGP